MSLAQTPLTQESSRLLVLTTIILCLCTNTCLAYRLVGSESLSDALVAHHYSINDRLDAVIVVDPTMPTFEYQTFYAMGYADEPEGEKGKLHFLEHLMADKGELAQRIARNGGQSRAATDLHLTYFSMRFPSDKLAIAIELDRERFYKTRIDQDAVVHEKKAVLTELSRKTGSEKARFSNHFWGLVYGRNNQYGIGTTGFIQTIESGDLKQLFHNVLRRKRRLVVVIGDVDLHDVLTRLAEAFPDGYNRKEDGSQDRRFPNPVALGEKYQVKYEKLSYSRFYKAWRIPALGHPDYASFYVLASILVRPSNSLRSSLLDSQIVETFSAWTGCYEGFSLIACNAVMPAAPTVASIENAMGNEIQRIKSHCITEDEFSAARNKRLRSLYSEFYDRSRMAYLFGKAFALTDDPLVYPRFIRQVKRVTSDDIARVAGQHLIEDNAITLTWKIKESVWSGQDPIVNAIVIFGFGGTLFFIMWAYRRRNRKPACNFDSDGKTHKYHY